MAETLGMTVTRLRAEMPMSEWAEWIAYKKVEAAMRAEAAKKAKREAGAKRTGRRRRRRR